MVGIDVQPIRYMHAKVPHILMTAFSLALIPHTPFTHSLTHPHTFPVAALLKSMSRTPCEPTLRQLGTTGQGQPGSNAWTSYHSHLPINHTDTFDDSAVKHSKNFNYENKIYYENEVKSGSMPAETSHHREDSGVGEGQSDLCVQRGIGCLLTNASMPAFASSSSRLANIIWVAKLYASDRLAIEACTRTYARTGQCVCVCVWWNRRHPMRRQTRSLAIMLADRKRYLRSKRHAKQQSSMDTYIGTEQLEEWRVVSLFHKSMLIERKAHSDGGP